MAADNFCKINVRYLPLKVHYFFLFGAFGCTLPYLPILAKQLGISAIAVGIMYSLLPLSSFLAKPFFGFLTDYFRRIKMFLISLIILSVAALFSILFIPALNHVTSSSTHLNFSLDDEILMSLPVKYDRTCLKNLLKANMLCVLKTGNTSVLSDNTTLCFKILEFPALPVNNNYVDHSINGSLITSLILSNENSLIIYFQQLNETCDIYINDSSSFNCKPSIQICETAEVSERSSVYSSYQFWIFTILAMISGAASASSYSLSDAACYEVLEDQGILYGRQRLWGTISWGVMCLFSGFLSDVVTKNNSNKDFSPGFYMMLIFAIIDVSTLAKIHVSKTKFSMNIFKDIKIILSTCDIIAFACGVYIIGALTSLTSTYEFWYLQGMNANQTLLGLAVAMQCLVGEVPFLFFSGWFIKRFGHFTCLAAAFAGFALRLGLYSAIRNPWLALPIDITHGLTFAIFFASMTSFASTKGPFGMEATMMGFLGGLYEGLGSCTGSFLGGVGFDKIGGRLTFLSASIVSLICIPAFAFAPILLKKISSRKTVKKVAFRGEIVHNGLEETY